MNLPDLQDAMVALRRRLLQCLPNNGEDQPWSTVCGPRADLTQRNVTPDSQYRHALWMCDQLDRSFGTLEALRRPNWHEHVDEHGVVLNPKPDEAALWGKVNRWVGFIQGILWANGQTSIDELRVIHLVEAQRRRAEVHAVLGPSDGNVVTSTGQIVGNLWTTKDKDSTPPTTIDAEIAATDREALGIYALMAYDVTDALDLILECTVIRTLETLLAMLELPSDPNTDHALNAILVNPVKQRLDELRMTAPTT